MALYTRTGDDGTTGLYGGRRTSKADPRVAVCGTLDELNCLLGLAASLYPPPPAEVARRLTTTQQQLFRLSTELADPAGRSGVKLAPSAVKGLESAIDSFEARLPTLKNFILPGGTAVGATLHLARAVCRRAERELVALIEGLPAGQQLRPTPRVYLNRLSDMLFVLARYTNRQLSAPERKVTLR